MKEIGDLCKVSQLGLDDYTLVQNQSEVDQILTDIGGEAGRYGGLLTLTDFYGFDYAEVWGIESNTPHDDAYAELIYLG